MYFLITPKNKKTIDVDYAISHQIFEREPECTVNWLSDSPLLGIRYKMPDGTTPFIGGTLEPLLNISKKRVSLEQIAWTVVTEFPEYLDTTKLFGAILENIFKAIGEFEIFVIPMDKTFTVKDEDSLEGVSMAIADTYPEMFKNNDELISKYGVNSELKNVIKELSAQPVPYAMFLAKLYVVALKNANSLTNEVMDAIVENIFKKLELKKWTKYRAFLLYKFMHGARYFRSTFLYNISEKTLIQTYIPLLEKVSINRETSQYLINDVIVTGINKSQNGVYRELKELLMTRVKQHKGVFMTFPDLYSYYLAQKTGDVREAFFEYIKGIKRKLPAIKLHDRYEALFPKIDFVSGFRKDILSKYAKSLSFAERSRYSKYFDMRAKKGLETSALSPSILTTLGVSILLYIATYIYLWSINLSNTFISYIQLSHAELVQTGIGIIFGLSAFSFVFILPIVSGIYNIIKIKKSLVPRESKKQKSSIHYIAIGFGVIATFMWSLVILNTYSEEALPIAITETHVVKGLDWHAFNDIDKIRLSTKTCDPSCYDETIRVEILDSEGSRIEYFDFTKKEELANPEDKGEHCKALTTILKKANDNNIKVTDTSKTKDVLLKISFACEK